MWTFVVTYSILIVSSKHGDFMILINVYLLPVPFIESVTQSFCSALQNILRVWNILMNYI